MELPYVCIPSFSFYYLNICICFCFCFIIVPVYLIMEMGLTYCVYPNFFLLLFQYIHTFVSVLLLSLLILFCYQFLFCAEKFQNISLLKCLNLLTKPYNNFIHLLTPVSMWVFHNCNSLLPNA